MDATDIQKSHVECLFDACSCDKGGDCECLCTALSSFAEMCNKVGVPIRWRSQDRCPIQCENGKQYQPCGPFCQQTCMDISMGNNNVCDKEGCLEGCFCPSGMVTDYDGNCIYPSECKCYYENKIYPTGSIIRKDCLICECLNGSFNCYENGTDCKVCDEQTEFYCVVDKKCIPKSWICVSILKPTQNLSQIISQ